MAFEELAIIPANSKIWEVRTKQNTTVILLEKVQNVAVKVKFDIPVFFVDYLKLLSSWSLATLKVLLRESVLGGLDSHVLHRKCQDTLSWTS